MSRFNAIKFWKTHDKENKRNLTKIQILAHMDPCMRIEADLKQVILFSLFFDKIIKGLIYIPFCNNKRLTLYGVNLF